MRISTICGFRHPRGARMHFHTKGELLYKGQIEMKTNHEPTTVIHAKDNDNSTFGGYNRELKQVGNLIYSSNKTKEAC